MLTKEEFSKRLKQALDAKEMKQSYLADQAKTSAANISNYIRGAAFPPLDSLVEIAKVLNISLDWLCDLERNEDKAAPKTLGDVARVFSSMLYWDTVEFSNMTRTEEIFCGDPYEGGRLVEQETTYPAIIFIDGDIQKFISDLRTMQELKKQGTIDYNLFSRWLNDRLLALDKISIDTQEPLYSLDEPLPS